MGSNAGAVFRILLVGDEIEAIMRTHLLCDGRLVIDKLVLSCTFFECRFGPFKVRRVIPTRREAVPRQEKVMLSREEDVLRPNDCNEQDEGGHDANQNPLNLQ